MSGPPKPFLEQKMNTTDFPNSHRSYNSNKIRDIKPGRSGILLLHLLTFSQPVHTPFDPDPLRPRPFSFFTCSVLPLSQKMVARGCRHCRCHVLFFLLAPRQCYLIRLVLCYLEIHQITLFSRSWIRQGGEKHRLRGDRRGPTFTLHQQTNWETKRGGRQSEGFNFVGERGKVVGVFMLALQIYLTCV